MISKILSQKEKGKCIHDVPTSTQNLHVSSSSEVSWSVGIRRRIWFCAWSNSIGQLREYQSCSHALVSRHDPCWISDRWIRNVEYFELLPTLTRIMPAPYSSTRFHPPVTFSSSLCSDPRVSDLRFMMPHVRQMSWSNAHYSSCLRKGMPMSWVDHRE